MPWTTPSLATVRQSNRDYIVGKLRKPLIPNDYPRVLADANAGNAHLNLQYIDWLSLQLLPDTAEQQFLDKWANIFLVNADGTRGRKSGTYASGSVSLTASLSGTILPSGSYLTAQVGASTVTYQTTSATAISTVPTSVPARCLVLGATGNIDVGSPLNLAAAVPGINTSSSIVVTMTGGSDQESDDDLRARLLARLREPPMGGDADDYVNWALSVAGVTRAWCAPMEQGVGTVTLRFMCDDLRASTGGYPFAADVAAVQAYVDTVRPVTVADFFVSAPTPQPVNFTISNLDPNTPAVRAAIASSVSAMLAAKGRPSWSLNGVLQPAQTIPAAWVSSAILNAAGVNSFDLTMSDAVMPNNGCIAILGVITYS